MDSNQRQDQSGNMPCLAHDKIWIGSNGMMETTWYEREGRPGGG